MVEVAVGLILLSVESWKSKMGQWWIIGTLTVIHMVGILIFTRGFLLTRTELPYYSNCSDVSQSPCFPSPNPQCWTKPAVDRLIIIVLDALRFDFVAPSTFFKESKRWMDRLPVLQRLASINASSARIFKAIADPPTTSLQRLKGLTTGGLPTFVDVGNSFGAPAIVEDNLIHQLASNGKRVVMMGDDTWVQLFPHHFKKAYPYPSFNVKDLHTVDNGCIQHLLPSLYDEDWDVLIAHFLGVDHAGHILGVDSIPMIEKLEQYNAILEKVIEVLSSQSGQGGLHENTLLLVMGDHGQTINGDHGGGSAEEVETSIFAMSFKKPPSSVPSEFDTSSCAINLDQQKTCISSIQQLDFAATASALIGVPFPFGSIGRVSPELYALGAGSWNLKNTDGEDFQNGLKEEEWMQNYCNVLCINSWQVKRYIDVYSASSVIGFSVEDLSYISDLYAQAKENQSCSFKNLSSYKDGSNNSSLPSLKRQINTYFNFLQSVAELARSKWTEFNLQMMGVGFGIILFSLLFHFLAIKRMKTPFGISLFPFGGSEVSFRLIFAYSVVVIRACSFLSNSYILEEGKVANFLLATTAIFKLRNSIKRKMMLIEAMIFLLLITILRFTIEIGLSKQAVTSQFMSAHSSWMLEVALGHPMWIYIAEIMPILALMLLAYLLHRTMASSSSWGIYKYAILGSILCYGLIAVHWASESSLFSSVSMLQGIGKNCVPQIIYAIGLGQLLLLAFGQFFKNERALNSEKSLIIKTLAMLSACSSTIILLSGKQGSLIALASITGGYCIMRLGSIERDPKNKSAGTLTFDPLSVTQWSLLATCLFFSTGHWCAFDGLRYSAAFIGFDEFILARQAVLLTIETFGFSHILPVLGLPFLVAHQYLKGQTKQDGRLLFMQLSQIYLMYGFIIATTVIATIICVTIHRRHLMVWGLFAPKFVFDVAGFILTDVLICLAWLYYFCREDAAKHNNKSN